MNPKTLFATISIAALTIVLCGASAIQDPVPVEPALNNKCCQRPTFTPGGPPAALCYDGPCLDSIVCSGSGTTPFIPAQCVTRENKHCTDTSGVDYPVAKYACQVATCPTNPELLTCKWVVVGPTTVTATGCSGSPCN